ncbi:MAG: Nif3-like dinuclear metal center hexameric protein [Bacillota bacterium]|nr:Nif3-like dinuclear metal center hexameric protein [Bacillota bacterium]
MNAYELYNLLEKDFELNTCTDSWNMKFSEYITDDFKNKSMGLVLDNTSTVNKVYTAVFPTYEILDKILSSGEKDILLFTHHPKVWDITKIPAFIDISEDYLKELKNNQISMYTLHTPLDKCGPFSTSVNLAKQLDIKIEEQFCKDGGVDIGVIGTTNLTRVDQLHMKVRDTLGHQVRLFRYGDNKIKQSKVALIAGGGNIPGILLELHVKGINTFLTGVTRIEEKFEPSVEFHKIAKKLEINVIGGTHYSTEKYACIEVVKYLKNLGIEAEFTEGIYDLEDLEK